MSVKIAISGHANMAKNRLNAVKLPKKIHDNYWKSIIMALEKPGNLREFFSPVLWLP